MSNLVSNMVNWLHWDGQKRIGENYLWSLYQFISLSIYVSICLFINLSLYLTFHLFHHCISIFGILICCKKICIHNLQNCLKSVTYYLKLGSNQRKVSFISEKKIRSINKSKSVVRVSVIVKISGTVANRVHRELLQYRLFKIAFISAK